MASCHTHAATKLSSHRTLRSLTICVYLCASVGGSSPPEASVYSVNSVGEPYVATKLSSPQNSRNTETTGGEYPPTDCTDFHRSRRVWHPCHTHAATKLSSHRIHGTHRNDWRRRKIREHLCNLWEALTCQKVLWLLRVPWEILI